MIFKYYPSEDDVKAVIKDDEPIMMVIAFDRSHAIAAPIDEAVEHHILLTKCGINSLELDKYFRIIFDREGADWTFVCPPNYKNIFDKRRRIEQFYNDGFNAISRTLEAFGYNVKIDIPRRYRRHIDELRNDV